MTTVSIDQISQYFSRDVAEKAAAPLSERALISLKIYEADLGSGKPTSILFKRKNKKNSVLPAASESSSKPDVTFSLTAQAWGDLVANPSEDVGEIGVAIAKLIFSRDPSRKVEAQLHIGLLNLLTKGYFGVLAAGGASLMGYLANHGFGSLSAIKERIKNLKT